MGVPSLEIGVAFPTCSVFRQEGKRKQERGISLQLFSIGLSVRAAVLIGVPKMVSVVSTVN